MHVVEMRCPVESQRMFGKLMVSGLYSITDGNLIEFACDRCRKRKNARQVLHRFDLAGALIESQEDFG